MDSFLEPSVAVAIEPYRSLLEQFVDGTISADEFEPRYYAIYLSLDTRLATHVFDLVDAFFADVDSYVPDGRSLGLDGIRADDLRLRARALLQSADG